MARPPNKRCVLRTDADHHFVVPDMDALQIGVVDRLIRTAIG